MFAPSSFKNSVGELMGIRFTLTLVLWIFLLDGVASAQSTSERERIKQANSKDLKKLEQQFSEQHRKDSIAVEAYLLKHPKVKRNFTKNNRTYSLVKIDKKGKPIYISTKKK
jgi:cbb3-type cytochrome oxidase subunit 3